MLQKTSGACTTPCKVFGQRQTGPPSKMVCGVAPVSMTWRNLTLRVYWRIWTFSFLRRAKLTARHTGNGLFSWGLSSLITPREKPVAQRLEVFCWAPQLHHTTPAQREAARTGNGCGQITLSLLKIQEAKWHCNQQTRVQNLSPSWFSTTAGGISSSVCHSVSY